MEFTMDNEACDMKNEFSMDSSMNPCVVLSRSNIFSCKMCTRAFLLEEKLDTHMMSHDMVAYLDYVTSVYVKLSRTKIFQCEECQAAFNNMKDYRLHQIQHVREEVNRNKFKIFHNNNREKFIKRFKCEECAEKFVLESTLNLHLAVHNLPYHCKCGISYYHKQDLKAHSKLVHPEEDDDSDKEATRRLEIELLPQTKNNIETNDNIYPPNKHKVGSKLQIEQDYNDTESTVSSDSNFKTERDTAYQPYKSKVRPKLKAELRTVKIKRNNTGNRRTVARPDIEIKKDENNRFICPMCNKTFASKVNVYIHWVIHTGERKYTCNICNKGFTQTAGLFVHMKLHSGVKEFKCGYCGKEFPYKYRKITHERTHTHEKPYKCSFCPKAFSDKSAHQRHERTHTGVKPYTCELCPMKFSDASGLIAHKKRHIGMKDFKCNMCTKKFYTNSNLVDHLRIHEKIRKYDCHVCGKKFWLKQYLAIHMATHGEKKYECDNCGIMFKRKAYLNIHIRTCKRKLKVKLSSPSKLRVLTEV